jgi:hypothetical protein
MQVYLPTELYDEVKARDLPVSQILQKAVAAELRRQDLLAAGGRYVAELIAEVGDPTPAQRRRARAIVRDRARARRKTG